MQHVELIAHFEVMEPELIERTVSEYQQAIKEGILTSEEAEDNLQALTLGMMRITLEEKASQ